MYGYHGGWLQIDLASGAAERQPFAERVLRQFLGGSGLGAWLMWEYGAAAVDPLAPQAPVAFVFSPLVGSPLTTSAKLAVVCKSPLTQRFNDALVSSRLALAGKQTGHDALVLLGRAPRWSVLVIDQGQVRLVPADDLLGCTCSQTEALLRQRLGAEYALAVIGPAGERQVRFATISHDGRHAGRGGSGAVLGAKRIKAVAVRGHARCRFADPEGLARYARELAVRSLGPATAKYREVGTVANLGVFNRLHALPTRNFQAGSLPEADALLPQELALAGPPVRESCAACTIGCEHRYRTREGHPVRMEYENLFALGPLCGVTDPAVVLEASRRCDEWGLDTISTGGTIALAMECAERGLLDLPGLRFGNGPALLGLVDQIAQREGVGDLLAEGSRQVARHLGGEASELAMHVKGLELPGYEPRALQTMGLGLAVAARGADHNRSGAYEADFSERVDRRHLTPQAARLAVETEDRAALLDSLILCKFLRHALSDLYEEAAQMLRLVCGWEVLPQELVRCSQRIVTARKLFNLRAGWTPEEDTLPARLLAAPLPDDPAARLTAEQLQRAKEAYYAARGWTAQGQVPPAQLDALDLAEWAEGDILASQPARAGGARAACQERA
jgi:aldehyde:ferredoxin oxidoreductase